MKNVVRILAALAIALMVVAGNTGRAQAQAKGSPWQVSITVLNVETSGQATININFYPGGGAAAIPFQPAKLNAGAGTSYNVSDISNINSGFKGSAVISSDQRVVATVVQFVRGGVLGKNVRPLSNGFQTSDASPSYLIPSVLNNEFNTVTEVSIQNVEASDVKATVDFFAVGATTPTLSKEYTIKPNEAQYIDASSATLGLPAKFNGSATIKAVKVADSQPGNVVAAINEYNTVTALASSVEAAKAGANTVYMPSALCNLGGAGTATSSYAIQNSDTSSASVSVVFKPISGGAAVTAGPYTLAPGAKQSVNGCTDGKLPNGFNGSATITSTGGKIVAIGKIFNAGLSTAFLGSTDGAQTLALPYVRFAPDAAFQNGTRQRAFIAIQNIGPDTVSVDVSYRDKTGAEVKKVTLSIAGNGGKANSDPRSAGALDSKGRFGEYDDGSFGGGAIISGPAGAKLVATVRIQSGTGGIATGEDYSGIAIQ